MLIYFKSRYIIKNTIEEKINALRVEGLQTRCNNGDDVLPASPTPGQKLSNRKGGDERDLSVDMMRQLFTSVISNE